LEGSRPILTRRVTRGAGEKAAWQNRQVKQSQRGHAGLNVTGWSEPKNWTITAAGMGDFLPLGRLEANRIIQIFICL